MNKLFLGGTCAETDWRDRLIPLLEDNNMSYFNPVVDDWTPDCIEIEENEKDNVCDTHLFLITSAMKGVYSIAEVMASAVQEDKKTLFVVISDGFDEGQVRSLMAVSKLIRKYGKGKCITHFMNESEKLDIIVDIVLHLKLEVK